jgi:hypothetical protein
MNELREKARAFLSDKKSNFTNPTGDELEFYTALLTQFGELIQSQPINKERRFAETESFWIRLRKFINDVQVSDMIGQEEKDMILNQCKIELRFRESLTNKTDQQ